MTNVNIVFRLMAVDLLLIVFNYYYLPLADVHKHRGLTMKFENVSHAVFKSKPLVIWTNDFHIGPIQDVKTFLQPMGVVFIDKNLDETRCHLTKSCAGRKSMKIINTKNAEDVNNSLIRMFYEAYQNDTEMQSVDAFACFHIPSLCELFAPFNKSMIIISTIRYERGRFEETRLREWNENLVRYASIPWNVVAANNRYDVEYIKYFTGIQPRLLPSFCGFTNQTYNAVRKGFLIAENRERFLSIFLKNFTEEYTLANSSYHIWPIRQKYRNYKYSDVAAHEGIVYVPYQVSVMSFFEQYRMNIPLFVPTQELLSRWVYEFNAMPVRRWNWYGKWRQANASIVPQPAQNSVPSPNSMDKHAIRYWMKFCDYYHFPHITYYKSIPDLVKLLGRITKEDLLQISERMRLFNIQDEKGLRSTWRKILLTIAKHSSNSPH